MISGHTLLLVVRAQNQAAAALGRVSRDLRRMSAQRDLELRRSAIANRLARNSIQQAREQARIDSVLLDNGAARLAHNQALSRNAFQQMSIQDRIANLDIRRTGIARTLANLEAQKLRIMSQELRIEQGLEKIELRRQAINTQIGRLGTQSLRNGVQQQALNRQAYGLQTQLLERQLRYNKARRALAAAERGGSGATKIADLAQLQNIARRRVQETRMAQAGIPGQRSALQSAAGNITAQIASARGNLTALVNERKQLAAASDILIQRQKALQLQLQNIQARSMAVTAAERQLGAELKIVASQVGVLNARWEQHIAVTAHAARNIEILQAEEAQLNAQLIEQNALLAGQNRQAWADRSRAIGHFGRVVQMAGLVSVAAFGMMAIGAANLNKEATRVATQTGPIASGTELVVRNAERASDAIIQLMKVVPANQQQLSDALYNIYSSMNTTFGQGTKLLKLFAQVWVAGGMLGDVNEVADALITLGNNWGIAAGDMQSWKRLAASTLATVRFGRLTVEQYTQTMNQLAPAFKGAHQSIEQMNGAIAFMTRLLPSQRMSAAGLARFIEIIGRFAAKPNAGFETLARSIQDAQGNLLPLDKIMTIFISRFPQLKTSGVFLNNFIKMISNQQGTVQARRALQALVVQNDLYNQTLKNTTMDQNEFNRSLKAMEQSVGVKWAQFVNDMRALALQVGNDVLPVMIRFGSHLQRLADWYDGLSASTKRNMATIGAYAAIVALLGGTLLTVVGSVAAMVLSMRILRGGFGLTAKDGAKLAAQTGAINTKFAVMAGSIAAAILILSQFHSQIDSVLPLMKLLGLAITGLTLVPILKRLGMFNGGLLLLGSRLSNIAKIGVITAGVNLVLSGGNRFNKNDQWNWTGIKEALNPLNYGRNVASVFGFKDQREGMSLENMKLKEVLEERKSLIKTYGADDYRNRVQELLERGGKGTDKMAAEMFKKSMSILDRFLYQFIREYDAKVLAARTQMAVTLGKLLSMDPLTAVSTAPWTEAGFTDAQILEKVREIDKLRLAYEKAPLDPAAWKAYNSKRNAVNAKLNKDQQAMLQDFLGAMSEAGNETKQISDAQALSMQRNLKQLEQVAKRTGALKDFMALQKAQAAFEKVATSGQTSAVTGLMAAEDALLEKRKENAKKARELQIQNMQNAVNLLKTTTGNIQQMFESALQTQEQNFGQLFSGRFITESSTVLNRQRFGFGLRPEDLAKDLKMQLGTFSFFNNSLEKLRKRGAPQEMIDQISQMGPEVQKQVNLLVSSMSPGQFKKYVSDFNKGQKLIQGAAEREINAQLGRWMTFGKRVALAIVNGVRSQNPELEDAIMASVMRMFPGLAKQAGGKQPQPVTNNETHNYNIHPSMEGKGLKSALKQANFEYRNRKKPLQ